MEPPPTQLGIPFSAELVPDEYDLLCDGCGYSLVGLTEGNRCPECGLTFDPTALPLARVPWLYRVRLGEWKAYWLTVGKILRDPAGFARELCRPVRISAEDAQRFRRRTVRRAVLTMLMPILGAVAFVMINNTFSIVSVGILGWPPQFLLSALVMMAGVGAGGWFLLTFGTDLPTFIWKGATSQNPSELSPIQDYASAPLALMPIVIVLTVTVGVISSIASTEFDPTPTLVTLAICGSLLLAYMWRTSAILMRVATGCGRLRAMVLLVYLPIHWALLSCIALIIGLVAGGVVFGVRILVLNMLGAQRF